MSSTAMSVERSKSGVQSRLARTGMLFAFSSAIAWIALGIDSIVRPYQDNARDTWWMLPSILMTLTFVYVHRVHATPKPKLENFGFWAVMVATGLVFAGNIGLQLNIKALSFLGFPGGAICWIIGMLIFGVGLLKAGALPKYAGWAIILFEPGSILAGLAFSPISPLRDRGAYSAGIEKGLAVAVVGLGLRSLLQSRE